MVGEGARQDVTEGPLQEAATQMGRSQPHSQAQAADHLS